MSLPPHLLNDIPHTGKQAVAKVISLCKYSRKPGGVHVPIHLNRCCLIIIILKRPSYLNPCIDVIFVEPACGERDI